MNVEEIREIAKKSLFEIVKKRRKTREEEYLKEIERMDKSIENCAKSGRGDSAFEITSRFKDRIIEHYEDKGFKVSLYHDIDNIYELSWLTDKEVSDIQKAYEKILDKEECSGL